MSRDEPFTGPVPGTHPGTNSGIERNGILTNVDQCNNLVTKGRLTDFKFHAEFRYPQG
ncbi:MAG: hypothetical protein M2R45_05147 [Verrucomicrobia subdivision 3 bacterium]|nr:hypothetical protein [Limisphaerales bacterium]MCS1413789.1 hypothetical protein [Limisphaerales bacterium]